MGSLVPTHHPDLLAVPRARMQALDPARLAGVRSYRTRWVVFGAERTVLVTYNPALFRAQTKTLIREPTKRLKKLRTIERRLQRRRDGEGRGKKPTLDGVRKAAAEILKGRHMTDLIRVKVKRGRGGVPLITSQLDRRQWARLRRTLLGKTLIFTDHAAWSDEDIIEAYRGQANVEAAFRQMKDAHFVSFRPSHHWTDQKLRVHAFYCVLALTLCALLRGRLRESGLILSIPAMLRSLAGIREITLVYRSEQGRPTIFQQIEEMDAVQRRLPEILDLERLAVP